MSFIEMKNIRKDFGKLTILHGVDMTLERAKSSPSSGLQGPARVRFCAA